MRKRIVVRNGRSPFQFALTGVCLLAGLLGLVLPAPGPSGNIPRVFGGYTGLFYLAMLLAAVVVLAGMVWPRGTSARFYRALEIERIGLWPLAGTALAYGAGNLAVSGLPALVSALLTGGIGVAALVRIRIIYVDLSRVDELLALDATREERP